jgi:hypothetical protein
LPLKLAVGAGIGLFIAFIGLKNAGIIVADPATLVGLGELGEHSTLLAIFGILVTSLFLMRKLRGAVFYGIVVTAIVGVIFGVADAPSALVSTPPSIAPTFGAAFAEIPSLFTVELLVVVFTMLFVDFFDTAGTLIAVTNQAGLLDRDGNLPNDNKALVADSTATIAGAALGTSTTTSYIESAAGVNSAEFRRATIRCRAFRSDNDWRCARRPRRNSTTESQTSSISDNTCDEKITVRPSFFAAITISNTRERTVGSRLAVGSSRISSGAREPTTAAIANVCRIPVDIKPTIRRKSSSKRSATRRLLSKSPSG